MTCKKLEHAKKVRDMQKVRALFKRIEILSRILFKNINESWGSSRSNFNYKVPYETLRTKLGYIIYGKQQVLQFLIVFSSCAKFS